MRIVLALAVCLCSGPALAQQTVVPSNRPQDRAQQQQTAPDSRGTTDQPFIVKQIPRDYSDDEKQQSADKAENDRELVKYTADLARYTRDLADYTKGVFGATCVLVLVTGLLWIFTALMWRTTRRAVSDGEKAVRAARRTAVAAVYQARASRRHAEHMEESAKAAQRAANAASQQAAAFIALESPRPGIGGIKLVERLDELGKEGGRDPIVIGPAPEYFQLLLLPINAGKNPLRIIAITLDYDIGNALPDIPRYWTTIAGSLLLRRDEDTAWLQHPAVVRLSPEQQRAINARMQRLWVYGSIVYPGLLKDEVWQVGFSAWWANGSGLVPDGTPAYNYDRKVDPSETT